MENLEQGNMPAGEAPSGQSQAEGPAVQEPAGRTEAPNQADSHIRGRDAGAVRAGILNRAIARFIDILIALLFGMLPGYIGFFAALTYICTADGYMGGRSPGKRLIGLRVVRPDTGSAADFRDSILRNSTMGAIYMLSIVPLVGWALAAAGLAFELVLMLGSPEGRRLGDEIALTVVLDTASPAQAGMRDI